MPDFTAPIYGQQLREAHELGRLDGAFASAFETPNSPAPTVVWGPGRTPAEFAWLLWEGRQGTPPIGLLINAPLWYATGFAEGLAMGADRQSEAATGTPSTGLAPDRRSPRFTKATLSTEGLPQPPRTDASLE